MPDFHVYIGKHKLTDMKKLIKSFLIFTIVAGLQVSCEKSTSITGSGSRPGLNLSKVTIKKGEPLVVNVTGAKDQSIVKWAVNPSGKGITSYANQYASFTFSSRGTYRVTAKLFTDSVAIIPYDSISTSITVSDSVYTPPSGYPGRDTISLLGDQLNLQPILTDTGFVILVKTQKMYSGFPSFINYSYETTMSNLIGADGSRSGFINFRFTNIIDEAVSNSNGAMNYASVYLFFNPFPKGTYAINFILSGVTYTGSLVVTDTQYLFSWNYTSGVIISPLQLTKP